MCECVRVSVKVSEEAGGGSGRRTRRERCSTKNKNPTRQCGEKIDGCRKNGWVSWVLKIFKFINIIFGLSSPPPLTSYSNMMLKGLIIGHWVYVWSYRFCSIHECFNKTTNPKQLCASQHNRFLSTIGFSIWFSAKKRFHDVMQFSVHEVHRNIIQ